MNPASSSKPVDLDIGNAKLGGRAAMSSNAVAKSRPVIVAIHGGTYTSAYFDVPGYSLMDLATERGFDALAIDRPGYGISTPLEDAPDLIAKHATFLNKRLPDMLANIGRADAPVYLIGHSIGGAIVIEMAAQQPSYGLVGIAVSGVGLKTPPEDAENYSHLPQQYFVELPTPMKDVVMFGPPDSHPSDMPQASHMANTTVPRSELIDITGAWQQRLGALAPKVNVPVHYRQGEYEKLWLVSQEMVDGFGQLFSNAGLVDSKFVKGTGHCIDFHNCGREFQSEQLAFCERLTA